MVNPVLVITSNIGLGELICQILNKTGKFTVSMATKAQAALQIAEDEKPALVIMETELKKTQVGDLLAALREKLPDLAVIMIAPEDKTGHASYAGMQPDGLLFKPVNLPGFVPAVESVLEKAGLLSLQSSEEETEASPPPVQDVEVEEPEVEEEEEETPSAPPWLHDVNLAAQYLTRLSLESSAQASLISKKDDIWAYAGELPRPAAEELARVVASHFDNGGGSDLARFIRLEETGGEYMLYATGMGNEYVLATVFNAETPFSKIRAQASHLAEALASAPPPSEGEEPEDNPEEEQEEPDVIDLRPLLDDVPPPIPNDWVPESSIRKQEVKQSLLDELLEGATLDTYSSDTVTMAKKDIEASLQSRQLVEEIQDLQTETKITDQGEQPDADKEQAETQPETSSDGKASVAEETRPSAPKPQPEPEKQVHAPESQQETQVSKSAQPTVAGVPQLVDQISVDPVSPSMYNLTYACVLIPRFPQHHLAGEVARWLSDWINDLTVAFGWRLEHLAIRPEYMQFLVNVPPNTSPGYLMRTIRKHTSRRMFVEFPSLEQENPSGDFWAPGYLILGNPQPPPPALVRDFIHNTRKRQGLAD